MEIIGIQNGTTVSIVACEEFGDARAIIRALAIEGVTYACVRPGTRPERAVAQPSQAERVAMAALVAQASTMAEPGRR